METTQTLPDYPRGITFEQVWAGIQELRESQKETDRQMKETDRIIKEVGEKQKETDRQMKETAQQMKETDRQMKETDKKMGNLYNRFGEMAEHLVKPNIHERFNELGYHFGLSSGSHKVREENGVLLAEFDTLLENKDYIMAIEIKTKPDLEDVEDHLKRLQILRNARDRINDHRKIHGGIAGAIFGSDVKNKTIKSGLFVIEQSGDTMKITVPQGFVPKEW